MHHLALRESERNFGAICTIKTPITPEGGPDIDSRTGLGDLMSVGAMHHTAELDLEKGRWVIQTNAEGLGTLACKAEGGINQICLSRMAIGDLMAYADTREVDKRSYLDIGWLLIAFGEMGMELQRGVLTLTLHQRLSSEGFG